MKVALSVISRKVSVNVMTVSTISRFPSIPSYTYLGDGCLFEVSRQIEGNSTKYISNNVTYTTLNKKVQEDSRGFLSANYGIVKGTNVTEISEKVDNLYTNATLSGTVTFKNTPVIDDGVNQKNLATEDFVENSIKENTTGTITPDSAKLVEIKGNDLIFDTKTSYNMSKTYEIPKNTTGNLVLWGWMADNGTDLHPAKCWVALKMLKSVNDSQPITLQVVPWIMGSYRNQLQYVSFNVPISSGPDGMFIRVDCGFDVSEENSGSQTTNMSLADSTPNKFVGYILGKAK